MNACPEHTWTYQSIWPTGTSIRPTLALPLPTRIVGICVGITAGWRLPFGIVVPRCPTAVARWTWLYDVARRRTLYLAADRLTLQWMHLA